MLKSLAFLVYAEQAESNREFFEQLRDLNHASRLVQRVLLLISVRNNHTKIGDAFSVFLNFSFQHGRLFMETFLKLGMPLLDCSFKTHGVRKLQKGWTFVSYRKALSSLVACLFIYLPPTLSYF